MCSSGPLCDKPWVLCPSVITIFLNGERILEGRFGQLGGERPEAGRRVWGQGPTGTPCPSRGQGPAQVLPDHCSVGGFCSAELANQRVTGTGCSFIQRPSAF